MLKKKHKGFSWGETIELKKLAEFAFTYYENAERVAMAFNLAHHFTTIRRDNSNYIVEIYGY